MDPYDEFFYTSPSASESEDEEEEATIVLVVTKKNLIKNRPIMILDNSKMKIIYWQNNVQFWIFE